jgi:hypothetical protein
MRPAILVHNPMVTSKPTIFHTLPRFVPGILHVENGHQRYGRIDYGSTTDRLRIDQYLAVRKQLKNQM